MSWYNPLTWFTPDWATGVTEGEANSFRLLQQAQDELNSGIITQAMYNELYDVYVATYGSVPASMSEARARGQQAYSDIINTRTGEALSDPLAVWRGEDGSLIPAWLKWAAAAALALLAINILTNAGILGKKKA